MMYEKFDEVINCHSDHEVDLWRSILREENSGVQDYQVYKNTDDGFISEYEIGVNYSK